MLMILGIRLLITSLGKLDYHNFLFFSPAKKQDHNLEILFSIEKPFYGNFQIVLKYANIILISNYINLSCLTLVYIYFIKL